MSPIPPRILVIDDEEDFTEILKVRLRKQGFEVEAARDGAQGMQKVISWRPHCVVVDVFVRQGEGGLDFLRSLHAFRDEDPVLETGVRQTPVIVLTASGSDDIRNLFQEEGVQDYIFKPFDPVDLSRRITRVISTAYPDVLIPTRNAQE